MFTRVRIECLFCYWLLIIPPGFSKFWNNGDQVLMTLWRLKITPIITSALGNSFNFGLLWAFSSIMVLRPWCGRASKWFLPTFLKLGSFSNDQSLMNFSATYKSFKLFRGRNASSWISVMLFFSKSLKRIFIIVNTTFFAAPFKWIPKIWVVFKLSFRKQKYFIFTRKSSVVVSAFLCWENSFSYIHLQFYLILWVCGPRRRPY